MMYFVLGFGAASVLWFFGLLTTPKIKEWYANVRAKVST